MTKTAKQYRNELRANTEAMYHDKITFDEFSAGNRRIWNEIKIAGLHDAVDAEIIKAENAAKASKTSGVL